MSSQRTHHITTTDGVTIGGTVHGKGPPLVFLQGVIGDGDLDWGTTAGHLTDKFTCYLPSLRGRGLSGDHPDLRTSRLIEDFATYVDSIGERVGLVGWSLGGYLALGVAETRPEVVAAVAPLEAVIPTLMDEGERAAIGAALARTAELAAAGDLSAAARAFGSWPLTADDLARADAAGYVEAAARYVPHLLNTLQQAIAEGYSAVQDPAALGAIAASTLVLGGSDTKPFMRTCAQYVADHVPHAQMQEISGAGHASLLTHPKALAEALTEFFSAIQQPA